MQSSHPVVLIAPNGREQAAHIRVSLKGIMLSTPDLKELNTFPLQLVRKWMPSHMRSKNVGLPDSLDIQLFTDQGPRDLRMRCADAAAVQAIMQELISTTQEAGLQLPLVLSNSKAMLSPQLQGPAPATAAPDQGAAPQQPSPRHDPAPMGPAQPEIVPDPQPKDTAADSLAAAPASLMPPAGAAPDPSGAAAGAVPSLAPLPPAPGDSVAEQVESGGWTGADGSPRPPPTPLASAPGSDHQPLPAAAQGPELPPPAYLPPAVNEAGGTAAGAAQPPASSLPAGSSNSEAAGTGMGQRLPVMVAASAEPEPGTEEAGVTEAGKDAGGIAAALLFDLVSVVAAAAPSACELSQALQEQRLAAQGLAQENAELLQMRESLEGELQASRHTSALLAADLDSCLADRDEEGCRLAAKSMTELALARVLAGSAVEAAERKLRESEEELSRCQGCLQASATEALREGECVRELLTALAASEQSRQELTAEAQVREQEHRARSEASELRTVDLERQVQELRQQLIDERAVAAHEAREAGRAHEELSKRSSSQSQEVQELSHRCAVLQAELATGQSRILTALEGQAILQVELACIREQFEAADALVGSQRAEVLQLRASLAAVEQQLGELRSREAEMQASLLSSAEEAEAARAEAGSMGIGQRELQLEAEVLRERLASVRQMSREQALAEAQGQLSETAEQLKLALQEGECARQQAADQKACNEQLQQDVESLTSELSALQEALEGSRTRQSSMSVISASALEKIRVLELNCEEAVQRLECAQSQLEDREGCLQELEQRLEEAERCRAAAEQQWAAERQGRAATWDLERQGMESKWEMERQGMESKWEMERQGMEGSWEAERQNMENKWAMERQGMESKWEMERQGRESSWEAERQDMSARVLQLSLALGEVEVDALSKYDGLMGLVDQVETLNQELQAAQISRARLEEQARLQAAVHKHDVCALETKLEAAVESSHRRVAAAEQQVEAKEQLLVRWREDAQGIAVKLEGALTEHRRELEEQRQEAACLQQQCKALKQDNAVLRTQLSEVQAAAGYLRSLAGEGDVRLVQLAAQLAEAQGRERELEQEVQALHMLLERARVAFATRPGPGRAAGPSPVHSARDSRASGMTYRQKHGAAATEPTCNEGASTPAQKGGSGSAAEGGRRTASIVVLAAE